jgi:hypothetical protein
MNHILQPFHLLVIALAGWLNRHQQVVIDYLHAGCNRWNNGSNKAGMASVAEAMIS